MFERHDREDLHDCPSCDRDFVVPAAVHGVEDGWFALDLWCANCGWSESGAYSEPALEALDAALEEDELHLRRTYRILVQTNLIDEAERFARALACDAIGPEDF